MKSRSKAPRKPLTAKEVAAILKIRRTSVSVLCREGKLEGAWKTGDALTNDWCIPLESVYKFKTARDARLARIAEKKLRKLQRAQRQQGVSAAKPADENIVTLFDLTTAPTPVEQPATNPLATQLLEAIRQQTATNQALGTAIAELRQEVKTLSDVQTQSTRWLADTLGDPGQQVPTKASSNGTH